MKNKIKGCGKVTFDGEFEFYCGKGLFEGETKYCDECLKKNNG